MELWLLFNLPELLGLSIGLGVMLFIIVGVCYAVYFLSLVAWGILSAIIDGFKRY